MTILVRTALIAAMLPLTGAAVAQIAPPATPVTPMTPSATVPYGRGGMRGAGDMGSMTLAQFQGRQEQRTMAADTDGDGRVSLAEYTASMSGRRGSGGGGGGGGGYDPSRAFARMDLNHDGFLDKSEIDAAAAERFRRMDANGDGVVTADERMASRGGGRGGGEGGMGRRRGYGGAPAQGQPMQPAPGPDAPPSQPQPQP